MTYEDPVREIRVNLYLSIPYAPQTLVARIYLAEVFGSTVDVSIVLQ